MFHETPLIAMVIIGLTLAALFGTIAHRLKISPIAGYLLAGILVGPHTPGFVADQSLALELAELGVILLMFGVGLHFSIKDLLSVRATAIPGAIAQILISTTLGMGLGMFFGWSLATALIFGLSLSVASTVVMMRTLRERRLLNSDNGKTAIGWLIVQDVMMVFSLVLLPTILPLMNNSTIASGITPETVKDIAITLAITFGKIVGFVAFMMIFGRRIIPFVLHYVAHTGSRELFRLCVLAIALSVAFMATQLFGVSLALGAFFAGMILSESELSQRAAEETLPLRDAFAVLFFVSVGMLFNPVILLNQTWHVVATVFVIILGQSLAAFGVMLALRKPLTSAVFMAAALGQIGEFSFILAGLGVQMDVLTQEGRDLILAGAIFSILLNPVFFAVLERLVPTIGKKEHHHHKAHAAEITTLENHVVLVGYGHVGGKIGKALIERGEALYVIEERSKTIQELAAQHIEGVHGNALTLLQTANLKKAKALLVAIPDSFEAGQIVSKARAINKDLFIVARGHSIAEGEHLRNCGASKTIIGAMEIAHAMVDNAKSVIRS
ncbi:MAG: YbaL family putative K(+) efflux transporter [Alphaproteobacteria bacterium]|nr:YbaL family putative K(+) efflux transporter [Alphaproteobacteria bacterium]